MASIEEVGKETKKKLNQIIDKVKTEFKEKPVFYTGLGVVVVFALYKLFNSSDAEYTEEEEVVTNAYVPVGYDGYPYMSESMVEDFENMYGGGGYVSDGTTVGGTTSSGSVNSESSSYVEDSYIYDETYYKDYIANMEEQNSLLYGELMEMEEQVMTLEEYTLANTMNFTEEGEVYNGLGDLIYSPTTGYKVLMQGEAGYDTQIALERADNKAWRTQQLQQMQANSSAWSKATTQAEKDALHDANADIAKGLGLTYNSGTGKWYEADGSEALIYSTPSTNKNSSSGSVVSNKIYNGVAYDANTDYAQKIKDAKSSGASQSVISALERQREAKKKGEGLDDYGNKVTSSSGSSSSKSSSSSSKSSSSSSDSKPKQGTVTGTVKWSTTKNSDGSTTHTATGSDGKVKASYTTK